MDSNAYRQSIFVHPNKMCLLSRGAYVSMLQTSQTELHSEQPNTFKPVVCVYIYFNAWLHLESLQNELTEMCNSVCNLWTAQAESH